MAEDIYADLLDFYSGEQIDSVTLIGESEPWWVVEVGSGPGQAILVWTESLAFHTETRGLTGLLNADGDPLPDAARLLQVELRRLLGRDNVTVEDSCQDEPALEVSVPLTDESTTVEQLAAQAWPVIATLTNVMDPGTFGAEYVMGNVATAIEEGK